MKTTACFLAFALAAAGAAAKLPAPSADAKAKADEAAAKAKWTDQVAAFKLCKSQDKVVGKYRAEAPKQGKTVKPAASTPPCTDPGPFAYTPPDQKPLEASGAHAPAGTATTPPATGVPQTPAPGKKP